MPFYEYECQACKFYTEVMQKITDTPLSKCPSCGRRTLKKLVSAPVFRLKGGGWYETDFKSEKEGKRNLLGAEKEESKPADKAPAKGAEAKDAKPADAKSADQAPQPKAAEEPRRAPRKRVSVAAKSPRSGARKARPAAKRRPGRGPRR